MKILKRIKEFQLALKKRKKREYENMISKRCNNKKIKLQKAAHDTLAN